MSLMSIVNHAEYFLLDYLSVILSLILYQKTSPATKIIMCL